MENKWKLRKMLLELDKNTMKVNTSNMRIQETKMNSKNGRVKIN